MAELLHDLVMCHKCHKKPVLKDSCDDRWMFSSEYPLCSLYILLNTRKK